MTVDGSVYKQPLSKRTRDLSGGTIVETGDPNKRRYDLDFSSVNVNFNWTCKSWITEINNNEVLPIESIY